MATLKEIIDMMDQDDPIIVVDGRTTYQTTPAELMFTPIGKLILQEEAYDFGHTIITKRSMP